MERFTRPVSLFCNMLATVSSVDGIRGHRKRMDSIDPSHGSAKSAELVEGVWRWDVFASKKRGLEVGKTKKGKGTKIMVMTEANGLPISAFTTSAQVAEVNTIETLVDTQVAGPRITKLVYDKAADADWLRDALAEREVEQVTPHRKGRKKMKRQDGRKLKAYRERWKIERTISWIQSHRRLLVRHEVYAHLFQGFLHLACLMICINRL